MPIEVTQDFLSPVEKQIEVEIPIHAEQPDKGTLLFTIRELPYAIKKSLDIQFLAASVVMEKSAEVFAKIVKGDAIAEDDFKRVGRSVSDLRRAQLDCIRWGVVSHASTNFKLLGEPLLFESAEDHSLGKPFKVASDKMLRLYSHVSSDRIADASKNLIALLSNAILDYQRGLVKTPQEIYAEHATPVSKDSDTNQTPTQDHSDSARQGREEAK